MSKYVGEAVKTFGGHNLRKRNTVGITPWGLIDNNTDLIGRDVSTKIVCIANEITPVDTANMTDSWLALDMTFTQHGSGVQAVPAAGEPFEQEGLS